MTSSIYASVLLMIISENLTNPHFISLQTAFKLESFRHSVSFSEATRHLK